MKKLLDASYFESTGYSGLSNLTFLDSFSLNITLLFALP